MTEYVVKPQYDGYITAILYDGICPYSNKKKEAFISEGYRVISNKEFEELDAKYEESLCGEWSEITQEEYCNHMDELPPVMYHRGGFFSPEATRGSLHPFYQEWNGKYYSCLFSIFDKREKIISSLKEYFGRCA